jgi:small subunit ribosomal protein S27Ae
MQIFVKTLGGETRVVNIAEGQTASEWKQLCAQLEGVDADLLTFVSEGSVLTDSDILSEKLSEEATVYVSLALDGGKKKKKRKAPTTKKKNKHKH